MGPLTDRLGRNRHLRETWASAARALARLLIANQVRWFGVQGRSFARDRDCGRPQQMVLRSHTLVSQGPVNLSSSLRCENCCSYPHCRRGAERRRVLKARLQLSRRAMVGWGPPLFGMTNSHYWYFRPPHLRFLYGPAMVAFGGFYVPDGCAAGLVSLVTGSPQSMRYIITGA